MTERSTRHATVVVERTFEAPPARVFAAWEDVDARTRWGVPAGDEIVFDESDFRVGGRDISRCGPAGDLSFLLEWRYQDIVPAERIVLTEIAADGATRLSVSLLTAEFKPAGSSTRLVLTLQVVALDGSDILDGFESGWTEVLENLARELR
ncbi:MAG: SRPBCC family protein [Chloroflexi bacterium]|nr:SRPBCC family protein [Chloroflexota bacterium]